MLARNAVWGVLVASVLVSPALAQGGRGLSPTTQINAAGETFINARTALEINYLCNAYKGVEHWAVSRIADRALGETGWYEAAADYDQYSAFVEDKSGLAARRAADMGCGPAAEPIAFGFLEQAMGMIYGDLILAFHFASLPADDPDHLTLTEDQIAAAGQYDMYLQQRFGPNFPTFAEHHRNRAREELSAAMATDDFDPLDTYGLYGLFGTDPFMTSNSNWEINWDLAALRSDARLAVDRVLLEVLVETYGLRMFDREHEGRPYADLVDVADGAVKMKVWSGPTSPYFNDEFEANYLLTLTETGTIQFIVWSKDAANQLGETPTIAIHANPNSLPKGVESEYDFYQSPDWIAGSERFWAQRTEDCLGTLCFEFSAEDIAQIIAMSPTETVELIISPRADAGSAETLSSGFRPGSIDIGLLKDLYADWVQG